jgi:hypothetical protein
MKLTTEIKAYAQQHEIWYFYEHINLWNQWEDGLIYIDLEEDFKEGVTGIFQFEGKPKIQFKLISVEKNRSFCIACSIPMVGDIHFNHELINQNGFTTIKHSVELIVTDNENLEHVKILEQIFMGVPKSILKLKNVSENAKYRDFI